MTDNYRVGVEAHNLTAMRERAESGRYSTVLSDDVFALLDELQRTRNLLLTAQADALQDLATSWSEDPDPFGDTDKDARNEIRDRADALRQRMN